MFTFHSCKAHYLYFRLRDQILLQPVVGQAGVSSLSVLAAGPKAPWPTCLLCNPRLGEAWRGCDLPDISFDSSSSCFAVFFRSVFLFLFVFGGAVVFFFFFLGSMLWSDSAHSHTKLVLVQPREQQELAEGVVAAHSSPCSERKTP